MSQAPGLQLRRLLGRNAPGPTPRHETVICEADISVSKLSGCQRHQRRTLDLAHWPWRYQCLRRDLTYPPLAHMPIEAWPPHALYLFTYSTCYAVYGSHLSTESSREYAFREVYAGNTLCHHSQIESAAYPYRYGSRTHTGRLDLNNTSACGRHEGLHGCTARLVLVFRGCQIWPTASIKPVWRSGSRVSLVMTRSLVQSWQLAVILFVVFFLLLRLSRSSSLVSVDGGGRSIRRGIASELTSNSAKHVEKGQAHIRLSVKRNLQVHVFKGVPVSRLANIAPSLSINTTAYIHQ